MGLEQDLKVINVSWQKENKTTMTTRKNQDLFRKRVKLKRLSL